MKQEREPYLKLANAIVLQACSDYLTRDEDQLQEIVIFFKSQWFSMLTEIGPDWLLAYLKQLRKEKNKRGTARRITKLFSCE